MTTNRKLSSMSETAGTRARRTTVGRIRTVTSYDRRLNRRQDHYRKGPLRAPCVLGQGWEPCGAEAEQAVTFRAGRLDSQHVYGFGTDFDPGGRVRFEIVEPGGVPRRSAGRGEDHVSTG